MLRHRATRDSRSGATLVESAIVLPVFLLFVIATVDLGLAVHRYNLVAWSAHEIGRQAAVHGSLAPPEKLDWGPDTVIWSSIVPVDEDRELNDIGEVVSPFVKHLREPRTEVQIEWPDGANHWGDRVRVTVNSPYEPLAFVLFGRPTIDLTATCTRQIEH